MSSPSLIEQYQGKILDYIFDYIGQKNVKAIILTGSVARNQANFKQISGETFLESDIDVVIVVRTRSLLKSLLRVKKLSRIVTDHLHDLRFLSEVSLSVVTEKAITAAKPSIFMFDLITNGKVIYKSIQNNLVFRNFSIQDVPKSDIYRLLFNRMVEALNSFVTNCVYNKFEEQKNVLILRPLEKLNLAIIQSIIAQEGIMIFNPSQYIYDQLGKNPVLEQDSRIQDISKLLNELQQKKKSNSLSRAELEKLWINTIERFKTSLKLYGFDETSPRGFDEILLPEGKIRRTISAILMLLQYRSVTPINELAKFAVFVARFGSDHIYFRMYNLYLTSIQFLAQSNTSNVDSSFDTVKQKWLDSFNLGMKIWKHKTGG